MRLLGDDQDSDERMLSPDEIARADAFMFARDRVRFVAAHAFLRRTLGGFVDRNPSDLVFGYGAQGRPCLYNIDPAFDFNLSHAGDLAVVAVSWSAPLGIDIEVIASMRDRSALAAQVMHPTEARVFERLAEHERTAAFFRLWTRKEAALKAMGTGLSTDPRSLCVGLRQDKRTAIVIAGKPCVIQDIMAPHGYAAAICAPHDSTFEFRFPSP